MGAWNAVFVFELLRHGRNATKAHTLLVPSLFHTHIPLLPLLPGFVARMGTLGRSPLHAAAEANNPLAVAMLMLNFPQPLTVSLRLPPSHHDKLIMRLSGDRNGMVP